TGSTARFSFASAMGTGIHLTSSTFTGNVLNAGTITAMATASMTGNGSIQAAAHVRAYGIWGENTTFLGNITNSGFIEALASASHIASGTAFADSDVAGIRLTGLFGTGTIANTGTLVHVSTFSGNVKNAGTI